MTLAQISYPDRDNSGNPLTMEDFDGQNTYTTEYTYDNNNRLDGATYPGPVTADFNYDWVGNRVNPPAAPNPMVFNAADQLTRWPGEHQYDYDALGNLTKQWADPRGQYEQKTYSYFAGSNLLQSVTHAGVQNPSQMTWDAAGNRITFSSSTGGDYTFVYDPTDGIPAVIEEYRQGSGLEPMVYIREPNGNLVARYDPNEFTAHWYYFDALGSTRMLTDGSGNVTDRYTYDAWGKLVDHDTFTGSVDQPYQYVGHLGYYTHHQDPNMDLLQLGVRFYDPEIGRFTQTDPVRYGANTYAYVDNRSLRYIDPTGLYGIGFGGGGLQFAAHWILGFSLGVERWECWDKLGCKHTGWLMSTCGGVGIGVGARFGALGSLSCEKIGDFTGPGYSVGGGFGPLEGGIDGDISWPPGVDSFYGTGVAPGFTWPPNASADICYTFVLWDDEGCGFLQQDPETSDDGPPYMPGDPRQLY